MTIKRIALAVAAGIALAPSAAHAAEFHDDPEAFAAAVSERGLAVDLAEDFEDARPNPGPLGLPVLGGPASGAFAGPLDTATDNRFFSPGQIPAGLRISGGPQNELAVGQPSSTGERAARTAISSPFSADGPVPLNVEVGHEAVALDTGLVRFSFVEPGTEPVGGPLTATVYGTDGAELGATDVDGFVGVVAPDGAEIGRIELSEPGGSELLHSVVAYDADGGEDTGTPGRAADPLQDLLGALGLR